MNVNLTNHSYKSLEVISMNGIVVLKTDITRRSGNIKIPVNKLADGIYVVKLINNLKTNSQKIIIQ